MGGPGRRQRTHPGGPAKRGAKPGCKPGASRSPQRGRRDGRAQGRTPPQSTAPGRGRQQAGASTRAESTGGAAQKKAAESRLCPPCEEPPRSRSPAGGEPGGTGDPRTEQAAPRREQGRPPPQGARSRLRGKAATRGRWRPRRATARTRAPALEPGAGEADRRATASSGGRPAPDRTQHASDSAAGEGGRGVGKKPGGRSEGRSAARQGRIPMCVTSASEWERLLREWGAPPTKKRRLGEADRRTAPPAGTRSNSTPGDVASRPYGRAKRRGPQPPKRAGAKPLRQQRASRASVFWRTRLYLIFGHYSIIRGWKYVPFRPNTRPEGGCFKCEALCKGLHIPLRFV